MKDIKQIKAEIREAIRDCKKEKKQAVRECNVEGRTDLEGKIYAYEYVLDCIIGHDDCIDLIEKNPKLSEKEIAHGLTLKKKARAWLNRKK